MVRTDAQEFFDMGSKFHEQGSFDDALIYYQKALDYLKNSDDAKTEGNILLEVGNIYVERDDFENGQKYYQSSLEAFKKAKDYTGQGYANTGIGFILEKQDRYVEARENYFDGVKNFEEKNDPERLANILSLIGGVIGLTTGITGSVLISMMAGWPTEVSLMSALLAFVFSGMVGIFFGFYPAYKASLLNPIDALRYE